MFHSTASAPFTPWNKGDTHWPATTFKKAGNIVYSCSASNRGKNPRIGPLQSRYRQ